MNPLDLDGYPRPPVVDCSEPDGYCAGANIVPTTALPSSSRINLSHALVVVAALNGAAAWPDRTNPCDGVFLSA